MALDDDIYLSQVYLTNAQFDRLHYKGSVTITDYRY